MVVAWNKGLTKEDPRVAKYITQGVETRKRNGSYVANSGTFEKGQTRARYPKGKPNPKLSEVKRKAYSKGKIKKLLAEQNPSWKGDKVGRSSIHEFITNRKPKPTICERCKKRPPKELSSNEHRYSRNLEDWEWLCVSCHRRKDVAFRNGFSSKNSFEQQYL